MYNRYKEMQKTGDKLFKGKPIYVIIDEVGTIGTYHDKKLRDSIFNDMIELFQKGRACKDYIFTICSKGRFKQYTYKCTYKHTIKNFNENRFRI